MWYLRLVLICCVVFCGCATSKTLVHDANYNKRMSKNSQYLFVKNLLDRGGIVSLIIITNASNLAFKYMNEDKKAQNWEEATSENLSALLEENYLYFFSKYRTFSMVGRDKIERVLNEIKLSKTGVTSDDINLEAGKILNATYILYYKVIRNINSNDVIQDTYLTQIVEIESNRVVFSDTTDEYIDLRKKYEEYINK